MYRFDFLKWLVGWVEVFCIMVYLLTFTMYRPYLDFKVMHILAKYKKR